MAWSNRKHGFYPFEVERIKTLGHVLDHWSQSYRCIMVQLEQ